MYISFWITLNKFICTSNFSEVSLSRSLNSTSKPLKKVHKDKYTCRNRLMYALLLTYYCLSYNMVFDGAQPLNLNTRCLSLNVTILSNFWIELIFSKHKSIFPLFFRQGVFQICKRWTYTYTKPGCPEDKYEVCGSKKATKKLSSNTGLKTNF